MARENPADRVDLNDVEMVFGRPASAAPAPLDVHSVANEKSPAKSATRSRAPEEEPAQPLLEPERPRPKPPLAGPEIDDVEGSESDKTAAPPVEPPAAGHEGIDDGLLEDPLQGKHDPLHPAEGGEGHGPEGGEGGVDHSKTNGDDAHAHDDGKWTPHDLDETDFYYGDGFVGNGLHNRFGEDRPGSPMIPMSIPDVNTYQQKKNLAQGMMDLALLSANANQLRYVLESSQSHPYFFPSLVFISCSIILQIAVGVGLIMNSRYNVKDEKDICKADKINNMTVLGVFLITIVNVFITSFSVATPATTAALQMANTG